MLCSMNSTVLLRLHTASDTQAIRYCRVRTAILALLLACTAFWASPAYAATFGCEANKLNKVLDAGVISIPMGATQGQTVAVLAPNPFQTECTFPAGTPATGTIISTLDITTAPAPGFDDVYPTSVAGLGVRYTLNAPAECSTINVTIKNQSLVIPCAITGVPGGPHVFVDMTVTPSFVVTGTVKSGASALTSAPTIKFTYTIKDSAGSWPKSPLYTGVASGTLSAATCSVQTPGIAISLPNATTRAFSSGVGATAGRQAFNLSFACATGAQVSIVITDVVDPTNRTNTLKLAPDSTAKGLGVQILKSEGTPVVFGPDEAGQSVENQWLIGASPNGLLQLPLFAQYIRTGTVEAGSIKAMATFTMSYK
jgi:type 1 fimbria pilin